MNQQKGKVSNWVGGALDLGVAFRIKIQVAAISGTLAADSLSPPRPCQEDQFLEGEGEVRSDKAKGLGEGVIPVQVVVNRSIHFIES